MRPVLHGDACTLRGDSEHFDGFRTDMHTVVYTIVKCRLGPGKHDDKQVIILSRVCMWESISIQYDADHIHAGHIVRVSACRMTALGCAP